MTRIKGQYSSEWRGNCDKGYEAIESQLRPGAFSHDIYKVGTEVMKKSGIPTP
jgi:hypothetical protein